MDQEHLRFVTALMGYYGTYHNHKESMAYAAAAFYVAGAAALMAWWFQQSPPPRLPHPLFDVVIGLAVLGPVYVAWQLFRRHDAAVRAEGCLNVATRWLHQPARPSQLEATEFPIGHDTWWPEVLAQEFSRHRAAAACRLWSATLMTLGPMLLAGAGAVWTVWQGRPW